ncbi:glycosyltransferase family 29 protein [Dongia sp.]|uniref:glycosyltransferase family 29 protein n=1 Tax=Dongia sp. TaxID=1977262 RepID=UPI0035B1C40E
MHIALVGHGASLDGAGRGAEIDAAGAVLRLHDCVWHVPADHGHRWTWGVMPGPWRNQDLARFARDLAIRPLKGWLVYHFGQPHPKLPPQTIPVDVRFWNEQLRRLTGKPEIVVTRGFAMFACAALLNCDKVTAYGFDAIAAGTGAGYRYHGKCANPVDEAKAARRHDFAGERQLIERIAQQAGMAIGFA